MISLKAKLRIYKLLEYVITSIVTPRCVERILKFLIKKKEKKKEKKKKRNEYKRVQKYKEFSRFVFRFARFGFERMIF